MAQVLFDSSTESAVGLWGFIYGGIEALACLAGARRYDALRREVERGGKGRDGESGDS
jgi:hypothetical protein